MAQNVQHLALSGKKLAYIHHPASVQSTLPGVLFCGGFNSNMHGIKAESLEYFCIKKGLQFTRFDYQGHGQSSGDFANCSINDWRQDTLDITDNVCVGKQIIVGSSMGVWLATLAVLARPLQLIALLGIAAAPDFTERLIWNKIDDPTRNLLKDGHTWHRSTDYDDGTPYPINYSLIKEGRKYLLLDQPISINCPVRLAHGSADVDVPQALSERLLECIESDDATLTLIKNGDHRLSTPQQLQLIFRLLEQLL